MPKDAKKVLVLLDMHAILHRSFHALPSFNSPKGEPTGALYGLVTMLFKAIRELKPDYIAAGYDLPEPTFRHAAFDNYKVQRPELDSNLALQIKRSYDILNVLGIKYFEHKKFEADDIIGTLAEKAKKEKDLEIIIASGDMDTLQLVEGSRVKVFTLRKGINDTVIYDEKRVKERYGFGPKLLADYKGIRGDPSDNIPGVPGIGEKGASELILRFGNLEKIYKAIKKDRAGVIKEGVKERVVKLLEEHEEEALFSRELGSIRRDVPIEFKLDELRWQDGYSQQRVQDLFKELGFISLLSRLPSESTSESQAGKPAINIGEASADFLKKEKVIFWLQDDGRIYAASSEGKVFSFEPGDKSALDFLDEKKEHYFFDAKRIMHTLGPDKFPEIGFDIKIGAWLTRPGLQNPNVFQIVNSFLPKEVVRDKEVLKAASLLPKLLQAVQRELKEKKLERVWEDIERPLIPVLYEMERRGILVDEDFLKELSKDTEKKLIKLQSKIWEMCGIEFNINSPKQLSEVLFDKLKLNTKGLKKTGTGARSTRESELVKLKGVNPVIDELLTYRELSKIKSTYLDPLPLLRDKKGKVHTTYEQTGAVTGRLSSSEPNLQNIPIRSDAGREIRKGFLASPGFELIAFDYSQIELRIAAILSGDEKMIKGFKEGKDIHSITAQEIFNVSEDKVTDNMRREAKVVNFGILYGMGVNALSQALEVPREEAQRFWEEYFKGFDGVYEYLEGTKKKAREKGYVETLFGRRRYLPEIYSQAEYIRKEAERMATNAPIQGTAADIVKLAMIRSQELIEREFSEEAFQLLQVHDEIVFEVKKKRVPEFAEKVKKIMESVYEGEVVLKAEAKVGPSWGKMDKYAILKTLI